MVVTMPEVYGCELPSQVSTPWVKFTSSSPFVTTTWLGSSHSGSEDRDAPVIPEPNQPVDQCWVSRPEPLKSSPKICFQLPGSPVGCVGLDDPEFAEVAGAAAAGAGVGAWATIFVSLTVICGRAARPLARTVKPDAEISA